TARVQVGLPEEAGGDSAPWPPALADLAQVALARPRSKAELGGDAKLQTEIAGRPNIGTAEGKDQVDLSAPPADPPECHPFGRRQVVGGSGEPGEIELPLAHRPGETATIRRLLPAKAAGAQGRLVERAKRRRGQHAADRVEAAKHRRRSVDRHLLFEDDVEQ